MLMLIDDIFLTRRDPSLKNLLFIDALHQGEELLDYGVATSCIDYVGLC